MLSPQPCLHAGSNAVPEVPALESLIWHASDAAVQPIVANRRIEAVVQPQWDPRNLPFQPLVCPAM